jgi:hypothetical protein
MRALFITVGVLGLILLGYSGYQSAAVLRFHSLLAQLEQCLSELERPKPGRLTGRLIDPSFKGTKEILEEDLAGFQRAWFVVGCLGAVNVITAISGLIMQRRSLVSRVDG